MVTGRTNRHKSINKIGLVKKHGVGRSPVWAEMVLNPNFVNRIAFNPNRKILDSWMAITIFNTTRYGLRAGGGNVGGGMGCPTGMGGVATTVAGTTGGN